MDRRYIKKMEQYWEKEYAKTLCELNNLNIESWFDFWHTHPDWKSKGNRSSETKAWVAVITYELLKETEAITKSQKNRLQVWAALCEDTGNNAIFIHSENPNKTAFPYDFSDVEWGIEDTSELDGLIDRSTHELGQCNYGDEVVYLIRDNCS